MKYNITFLLISILFLSACNSQNNTPQTTYIEQRKNFTPTPKQFKAVWNKVKSNPVETLPQEEVSYSQLFAGGIDLIARDANRTLSSHKDILSPFKKLAHPNGVCMRGVWSIDQENPYSGYFEKGKESLLIARASSAMSNTKRGETRAFGLAVKLFGTMDENETLLHNTANIFTIDDLGGTDAEYFMDVSLTNEPDVSLTWSVFASFAYALKVANTFSDADSHSTIRQLYEVSYLDENSSHILTPKWIKLSAKSGQIKTGVNDFREEFAINSGETIIYEIAVSSSEVNGSKVWQTIGTITFDASVISNACDHQLHFHHPRYRDDIIHL